MKVLIGCLVFVLALPLVAADRQGMATGLAGLQKDWAEIQYRLPEDQKEKAFEKLAARADGLVDEFPGQAEPLIWQGIVLSTYAGAKGGLGALGLVKDARAALEQALDIDPRALEGSAYTSLGSLYYQVPGWPLSFGDDKKAERYLQKALAINPEGIDANYFYGDFLLQAGQKQRARVYLEKALSAAPREGRSIADSGRRSEAKSRLEAL